MPVSVTKSNIPKESISNIVKKIFGKNPLHTDELKEGFFNAAYKITLDDSCMVLKIAPSEDVDIMTHEKNIMFSEVDAMKKIAEITSVPVPRILFYDNSRTLLDREYFFMEMLKGNSLSSQIHKLSDHQKHEIYYNTGKYTNELNKIHGKRFGYYSQGDKQGDSWYEVFRSMILDTYHDAERKNIHIPAEKDYLTLLLQRDKAYFEEVTIPCFVHWDIWDGNIFIYNGGFEGIIDFERCLWADPLMEVGFRTYGYNKAFFDGYGIKRLSESEARRAKWYDIYLFLVSCLECDYRMYDNRDSYRWACDMLKKCIN